jgi:hypothetical protein
MLFRTSSAQLSGMLPDSWLFESSNVLKLPDQLVGSGPEHAKTRRTQQTFFQLDTPMTQDISPCQILKACRVLEQIMPPLQAYTEGSKNLADSGAVLLGISTPSIILVKLLWHKAPRQRHLAAVPTLASS